MTAEIQWRGNLNGQDEFERQLDSPLSRYKRIWMENGNGGGVGGVNQAINYEDVISKLKDDGDFDKLRLKIIRKLKENEELRKNIVSIVKQSVALNRPGAENMKPRQLSDTTHQKVGATVNEQISNGLWEIIRSPDGIKTKITETVESVYNKLSRPNWHKNADPKRTRKEDDHRVNDEPKEPPGFSETVSSQIDINLPQEQQKETLHQSKQVLDTDTSPPAVEQKDEGDGTDEDPDAPPGFG